MSDAMEYAVVPEALEILLDFGGESGQQLLSIALTETSPEPRIAGLWSCSGQRKNFAV